MFLKSKPRGKKFRNAGIAGFPYLEIDSVHFRERDDILHLHEIYQALRNDESLNHHLDKTCLADNTNATLENDLKYRERHMNRHRSFWGLALPDIPFEPSEGLTFQGPLRIDIPAQSTFDRSSIGSREDQFDGAKLVVAPFRCFHRADGESQIYSIRQ